LTLCSRCGERIYCSERCQRRDWPEHKLKCGKTHRINLESFYPVLAVLADAVHSLMLPPHFAMLSRVVNDINPSLVPSLLPNGALAKLLEIDDIEQKLFMDPLDWAPLAQSRPVAAKMMQRIMREGHLLPILTALCVSLLGEMYTTTSVYGSNLVRKRLQYRTSPIADFGIARGSVYVHESDRLVYKRRSNGTYVLGQDPEEHFWLYFTTIRGEEVILDVGMFTFNFCTVVKSEQYTPPAWKDLVIDITPAFFINREIRTNAPGNHTEHKRVSALRDSRLHQAVRYIQHALDDPEIASISAFMKDIAGRTISKKETTIVGQAAMSFCPKLEEILEKEKWRAFPEQPPFTIQTDPGERSNWDDLPEPKRKKKPATRESTA
ncbi:uncharacterized protein PHACADRAFT_106338, partial [Phanerochaete carnosa HHB-10118-sp]